MPAARAAAIRDKRAAPLAGPIVSGLLAAALAFVSVSRTSSVTCRLRTLASVLLLVLPANGSAQTMFASMT